MTDLRVLVTDAGRGSAIAVVRSLGRRGITVIAADHDPRSPGFRSRFAAERLLYPDPARDPAGVVEALHRAAAERRVDLIIPVSDDVLVPLADARERFEGIAALAIPDSAALACVTDKHATLALARRLGVPVPASALVETVDEALEAAPAIGWPIVVKPVASRRYDEAGTESFEVSYADGPTSLARQIERLESRSAVLLQRYHEGEGHGVELLTDRGRPLAVFQHRRLHEVPITGGASALRESVPVDPVLRDHAVRLLAELEWTGLAMVEFRVGADGPVLMEINGRIWGSLPLAVKSGVDFPAGLAQLYLRERMNGASIAEPLPAPRIGVRSRNLGLELVWIASVLRAARRYPFLATPPRRQGLAAALRLLSPHDGFDVLCREDPVPGLLDAGRAVRHVTGKVRHGR
ncbi:MAG TPA: ATP-grasp domain-containing protein [Solirubrobacteraceae bacterium]|nr:ATP-grasp domain-containing protein [Solirubrobacteraceae bacterium]